ncbi:hypothetical protein [Endozoicomonas sp.]|uniref:hypothetical protein n=1 Tax=Endozoicomonas sp. TaxID=1892382 RepID=UPI0028856CEC|nr:hypothetical protein [Endozoicomonas sp.]
MNLINVFLESGLIPVLISVLVACFPVFLLNRFFIRQTNRYWLGLAHGSTGWRGLTGNINFHFAYNCLSSPLSGIYRLVKNT